MTHPESAATRRVLRPEHVRGWRAAYAFCLDMHARDARKLGESERRIYLLGAWRDSGLYWTPPSWR